MQRALITHVLSKAWDRHARCGWLCASGHATLSGTLESSRLFFKVHLGFHRMPVSMQETCLRELQAACELYSLGEPCMPQPLGVIALKNVHWKTALRDPGILECLDQRDGFVMVQTWNPGKRAREVYPGAWDEVPVWRAMLGLASVLLPVHKAGWAHCDISHNNVLVPPSGWACLVDFGSAQLLHSDASSGLLTALPATTPLFASPAHEDRAMAAGAGSTGLGVELAESTDSAGSKTQRTMASAVADDTWAVGALMYWLMTRTMPATGLLAKAMTNRSIAALPLHQLPRQYSIPLRRTVLLLLHPDPGMRLTLEAAVAAAPDAIRTGFMTWHTVAKAERSELVIPSIARVGGKISKALASLELSDEPEQRPAPSQATPAATHLKLYTPAKDLPTTGARPMHAKRFGIRDSPLHKSGL